MRRAHIPQARFVARTKPETALLPRFDVHMPQPNHLVNRWLTAVLAAHETEIADLIRARDESIADHRPEGGGDPRASRAIEVTAEHRCGQ